MKHSKFYAMALLMSTALFTTASCDSSSDDLETPQPTVCPVGPDPVDSLYLLLGASIDNAFPLFSAVDAVTDANKNFTISPLSLSEALAIASNGANGETRKQIAEIIGMNGMSKETVNEAFNSLNNYLTDSDSKTTFSIANSMWIDEGFEVKPEFLSDKELIGETFYQPLSSTKTMNDFNNWCDTKTNGCIKEMLKEPFSDCMMVIANALYFKGTWKYQFDKNHTSEQDFNNSDGTKSKVQMMSQRNEFRVYFGKDMDIVELPYGSGYGFCMDVILPHEGKNLDECMKGFTRSAFEEYIYIKSNPTDVVIQMPRMKLECTKSLVKPLMAMGMTDAFSEKADFSGISDKELRISEVIQSTYINVDEEGTEAAAATEVEMTWKSGDNVKYFTMNRPFAYVIRDLNTWSILFMGKVRKL